MNALHAAACLALCRQVTYSSQRYTTDAALMHALERNSNNFDYAGGNKAALHGMHVQYSPLLTSGMQAAVTHTLKCKRALLSSAKSREQMRQDLMLSNSTTLDQFPARIEAAGTVFSSQHAA